MYKTYLVSFLVFMGLAACSEKKTTVDSGLKSFRIEGTKSRYDLKFNFPETFVSIPDMDEEQEIDTTDIALNWIFNMQYDNPEFYCLFDSLDTKKSIFIRAGNRIDISNRQRDMTYFSVPTMPLSRVFPPVSVSDSSKIIYDSGEKKYKEKTYYKRTYQSMADHGAFSDYYYLTTTLQSVLVIVNSPKKINMDKYVLDYEVHPRAN